MNEEQKEEEKKLDNSFKIFLILAVFAAGIVIGVMISRMGGNRKTDGGQATGTAAETGPEVADGELYDYAEAGKIVMGDYKSMIVSVTPDDEDIDAQLQYAAEEVKKKAAVKKGDYIFIDYTGMIDGGTNDELTAADVALKIGEYKYEKKFEDQMIGRKKGDVFTIKVPFRDDYPDDVVAGRTVDFSVSVRGVFNDKMAKEKTKGKCATVEAYRRQIKEKLKRENVENIKELAWTDFINLCEVKWTEPGQVQEELEALKKKYARVAEADNMTYDNLLTQLGITEDNLKIQAEDNVKERMLAKTLAKKEKLTLDDDTCTRYLLQVLGYTEKDDMSLEALIEEYKEDYGCRPRDDILVETAKRFISNRAGRK